MANGKNSKAETARRALRRVSIRYTVLPEQPRSEHWKTCDALAKLGVFAHDWRKHSQPSSEDFQPEEEIETSPIIVAPNGEELAGDEWLESNYKKIADFLIENGCDIDYKTVTVKQVKHKRSAGGKISDLWVNWSDIGPESYENGYALSIKLQNPESDDENDFDFANIRLNNCDTTQGLYQIDITGPAWVLDTEEVEEAIGFVSHRIDGALKSMGYSDPEFGCSVDLHYSRTEACDVSWLAKQMAVGAKDSNAEDEEE